MRILSFLCLFGLLTGSSAATGEEPLQVSGIYPHLTVYNGPDAKGRCKGSGGECGIGAVVPWAGKLWLITYSPHCPNGSADKLFTIDEDLALETRPESVGGTPAGRMIHRETEQLLIGPYLVDKKGDVRVIDPSVMPGRITAMARHLSDPANKVYYYDMEGMLYEADVNSLDVKKLFDKPVPGWHGKGAYTAQGRFVVANNGEMHAGGHSYKTLLVGGSPKSPEEMGVLAEWDGKNWKIVERKQFTDVTGPGGIEGNPDDESPLWSIGWDKRSVILKLLDKGKWLTYRLPKGTYTYDHRGGWYTEWPRIREVLPGKMLMDMHGVYYDFPKTFSATNSAGIRPLSSHLRYVPDFCGWNGQVVLAADDTSMLQNPMAGKSQSNLWFGTWEDLSNFGPRIGQGGPWINDVVKAGEASDPFLIGGYTRRAAHLKHDAESPVRFRFAVDRKGNGTWDEFESVEVPAGGYRFHTFPEDLDAEWIRVSADKNANATVFFQLSEPGKKTDPSLFASLADVDESAPFNAGIIRPGGTTKNLQYVQFGADGKNTYDAVDEALTFLRPSDDRSKQVERIAALEKDFKVDEASVIVEWKGKRYRLPKGNAAYDKSFPAGWPRGQRECVSERYLANWHGTFYEIPREGGIPKIKPVASHNKKIQDYCTWRGLLVMSGTKTDAMPDGNYFGSTDAGLWFGHIDDLWKLGKPVGHGGPWKATKVDAGDASDTYLMNGYDRKRLELSHDQDKPVTFTAEVNVAHDGWTTYETFTVQPGQRLEHAFPEAFGAYWIRFTTDKPCEATVMLTYE
ncbi:hypothetical protein Pan216_41450 [Planctomycetes bacterium Pan216]|uniref:Uncharacterized protein n=2 Tax=Kolteria novifilia TaxID=2527975 RepID=A0A518B8G1_9BACT|nr:hypothetical protein Pan216_41450 [Planctomycetes bacterium Pan216]